MKLIKTTDILKFTEKNLPTILSVLASIGVVGTGVLAYKTGKKVEEENALGVIESKSAWKYYIPPVVCGTATIACIIASDRIHFNRETALAAALTFWKTNYNDLDKKIVETLGEDKAKEIKADIQKDHMEKNPPTEKLLANSGDGKFLCYEPYTEQWFRASKEQLLWAELTANKLFATKGGVKLNDVLELYPGCKRVPAGDKIGWFLDDFGCYNASYFFPGVGHQWIEIAPQLGQVDGRDVMVLEYSLNPYEPDEPEEWK